MLRGHLLAVASMLLLGAPALACTTFLAERDGRVRIGKSYDWHEDAALVLVNKRGHAKRSLVLVPGDQAAEWTSRYASVTFNQYGREMPNGGMNTAGLVVEIMWLRESRYPPRDGRPTVNELQWIQYQLDNFPTVQDVLAELPKIRVSSLYAKVHYLVCDRTSACAAIEAIDGKLVATSGPALEARALTNHTWEASRRFLGQLAEKELPRGKGSLERFARASRLPAALTTLDETATFSVLDAVRQGDYTKWNIAYDPIERTVSWRTLRAGGVKRVDLKRFDASCRTPVRMFDMNSTGEGDAFDRFTDYTTTANRTLLEGTASEIKEHLPPGALFLVAGYPNLAECRE